MSATISHEKLPANARQAIVRNITGNKGNWVLINLDAKPLYLLTSGTLTRTHWLSALTAIRDEALGLVDTSTSDGVPFGKESVFIPPKAKEPKP